MFFFRQVQKYYSIYYLYIKNALCSFEQSRCVTLDSLFYAKSNKYAIVWIPHLLVILNVALSLVKMVDT